MERFSGVYWTDGPCPVYLSLCFPCPAAAAGAKKPEAGPKPANKADVVFEGTEADLQKVRAT
jgi:hypothetical protein